MKRAPAVLALLLAVLAAGACTREVQDVDDSDPAIKARIESSLRGRKDVDAKFVTIDVNSGVVTISGLVSTAEQSRAIERVARTTHGVEQTLNNLLIQE